MDQVCGICARSIDLTTSTAVPCSGVCDTAFHSGCVGFSNLSAEQMSFLVWFCDACQSEHGLQRDEVAGAIRNLCRRVEPEAEEASLELPTELLEKIFRLLNFRQLTHVRRTCHRWKAVVDGSTTLMRRFHLKFPAEIMMDRDFDPGCLLPASTVDIREARIVSVDPWWPAFGEKLVDLSLTSSVTSLPTLAKMLRQTPNLQRFKLNNVYCPETCDVTALANFQLNRIEKLVLTDIVPLVRDLLYRVCTGIKQFYSLEHGFIGLEPTPANVLEHLGTWQNTLTDIAITPSEEMLAALGNLKELRLTAVCIMCDFIRIDHLLTFFQQQQQSLKRVVLIGIELSNSNLSDIGCALPELCDLQMMMNPEADWNMTFLNTMPKLEILGVRKAKQDPVDALDAFLSANFRGCQSPMLREIELHEVTPSQWDDLTGFFHTAANLQRVALTGYQINDWSDVFESLPMTKLKSLSLEDVSLTPMTTNCDSLVEYYENLQTLTLITIQMPGKTLKALFRLCPGLRNVTLTNLSTLTDDVVLVLAQKLKLLTRLAITKCPITDDSVRYITLCPALEHLALECCHRLTEAAHDEIDWSRLEERFEATVRFKKC